MKRIALFICLLIAPAIAKAQTADELTYKALGTVAFGSVTASFTTFLTNTNSLTHLDVLNWTNSDLTCNFLGSGTADHVVIPAYTSYGPPLEAGKKFLSASVRCKYTSAAPTAGSVYVTGAY